MQVFPLYRVSAFYKCLQGTHSCYCCCIH